jgi:hypothetical protein
MPIKSDTILINAHWPRHFYEWPIRSMNRETLRYKSAAYPSGYLTYFLP